MTPSQSHRIIDSPSLSAGRSACTSVNILYYPTITHIECHIKSPEDEHCPVMSSPELDCIEAEIDYQADKGTSMEVGIQDDNLGSNPFHV